MISNTFSWVNPNGNANFPMVNENGNRNFNWADNNRNDNWLWLVEVSNCVYSPRFAGFVFAEACFNQPPSIFPISSSCSERCTYFLLSSALLSQATCRKNLSISRLREPFCRATAFLSPMSLLARKQHSMVSIKRSSIFCPSVYRRSFGKLRGYVCQTLYDPINLCTMGRFVRGGAI